MHFVPRPVGAKEPRRKDEETKRPWIAEEAAGRYKELCGYFVTSFFTRAVYSGLGCLGCPTSLGHPAISASPRARASIPCLRLGYLGTPCLRGIC
eukprot:1194887-Prorocentrum_minimum.AAC.2